MIFFTPYMNDWRHQVGTAPERYQVYDTEDKEMNKAYEEITNQIISQLQQGQIPWTKPWFGAQSVISYATGRPYSILNQMLLGDEAGEYITWHQIQEQGGHLKKGCKGRKIYLWKTIEKTETTRDGEIIKKQVPYLRSFVVFKIADCDGIQPRWQPKASNSTASPIESAENTIHQYLSREKINLIHKKIESYYSVKHDHINIPEITYFRSAESYYSVLAHEAIHSTGAETRLSRFRLKDKDDQFGSEKYSREELVAEMGSAFLLHHLGIDSSKTLKQNAAYIQNWLEALKNDTNMVVVAATRAEKAVQYILTNNK